MPHSGGTPSARAGPVPGDRTPKKPRLEQWFAQGCANRLGATLPPGIDAVTTDRRSGLTNSALHLIRALDAVTAGLTVEWSSGSVEGAVNRIRRIRRQLYGRAGFELLRKLLLLQQRKAIVPGCEV